MTPPPSFFLLQDYDLYGLFRVPHAYPEIIKNGIYFT